jgi:hypothetical protein
MRPGRRTLAALVEIDGGGSMTHSREDAEDEPIDFDRVVTDGDYRRAVMRRLRAERSAAPAPPSRLSKAQPIHED